MPRMNLTDDEALLVEKHRARTLGVRSYNEGVQKGMDYMHDRLNELMDDDKPQALWSKATMNILIADAIKLGRDLLFRQVK